MANLKTPTLSQLDYSTNVKEVTPETVTSSRQTLVDQTVDGRGMFLIYNNILHNLTTVV